MLVVMLSSSHPHLQRQASKALANLGVNTNNKERICHAGGVGPLVNLAHSKSPTVAVEAVAALANLAVNGESTLHADTGWGGQTQGYFLMLSGYLPLRFYRLHVLDSFGNDEAQP